MQAANSAVLVVLAAAAEDGSLQAATGAAEFVFQKTHKTKNKSQQRVSAKWDCLFWVVVRVSSWKKKMQRIWSEAQKLWRVVVVVVQIYARVD